VTTWVSGLNLEKVSIPQYGVKDGSVTMICDFQLGSDTLLNLKWYKDGHEFFRYSPQLSANPILTFPVDGVIVDVILSSYYFLSLSVSLSPCLCSYYIVVKSGVLGGGQDSS